MKLDGIISFSKVKQSGPGLKWGRFMGCDCGREDVILYTRWYYTVRYSGPAERESFPNYGTEACKLPKLSFKILKF